MPAVGRVSGPRKSDLVARREHGSTTFRNVLWPGSRMEPKRGSRPRCELLHCFNAMACPVSDAKTPNILKPASLHYMGLNFLVVLNYI